MTDLIPTETRKGRRSDTSADDVSLRSVLDATKIELMNELRNIHSTLNALQSKICNVEGTLLKVLETQKRQDAEIQNLKEDVLKIKENHTNILAEFENRDRRKTNLILSGFPEKEDGTADERKDWDLLRVQKLFSALDDSKTDVVSCI